MISGAAAIAGIGATEFSKDSGRSELKLAAEAASAALADAASAASRSSLRPESLENSVAPIPAIAALPEITGHLRCGPSPSRGRRDCTGR